MLVSVLKAIAFAPGECPNEMGEGEESWLSLICFKSKYYKIKRISLSSKFKIYCVACMPLQFEYYEKISVHKYMTQFDADERAEQFLHCFICKHRVTDQQEFRHCKKCIMKRKCNRSKAIIMALLDSENECM